MTLLEQIREDMKTAMRGKDMATLDTVRLLLSSIKNKAIEIGRELEDADVIPVIKSDLKKLRDGLESFTAAARVDLADKAKQEIAVLEKYLPPQMSDEELEAKVRDELAALGISDKSAVGKAMGSLMKALGHAADGSRIKAIVNKVLTE